MLDSVQPLRISKSATSTPNKIMVTSRPLAELGSGERRRNSPSYNQATRKMIVSNEASPYIENAPIKEASPRPFWSLSALSPPQFDRENTPHDRDAPPSLLSPKRRASIERLKQASRVKTSNIFALQEKDAYDPFTTPVIERPTTTRISQTIANNTFTRNDSLRKENKPFSSPRTFGHKRSDTEASLLSLTGSPTKSPVQPLASQQKESSPSPTKSSLSRISQFSSSFDPDHGTWSDSEERSATPRGLHRHNKSVTFHEDPPVINEYEDQTPEPSVTNGGSRESSYDDSEEYYEQEHSFDRAGSSGLTDDSFDEDLENADKTPIVYPGEWSQLDVGDDHRESAVTEDDVFESSVEEQRPAFARSMSAASDGESRPLPPLPAFLKERRNSGSLEAATERASQALRSLPSPPKRASCSKDDILKMTRDSSLTVHDRMQLMSEQIERPSSKHSDKFTLDHGAAEELTITNLDTGESLGVQVKVAETEVEEDSIVADLTDFANSPPKISRESILRKVRNSRYEFEQEDEDDYDASEYAGADSPARPSYAELARFGPDDPIPSRETDRMHIAASFDQTVEDEKHVADVEIKQEPLDEDETLDFSAIPAASPQQITAAHQASLHDDQFERESSVLHRNVFSPSGEESTLQSRESSCGPEAESTVLHNQYEASVEPANNGKETLQEAMELLTVKDYTEKTISKDVSSKDNFMGLPAYLSTGDYGFGMEEYMTEATAANSDNNPAQDMMAAAPMLQPTVDSSRPVTKDLPYPSYDGAEYSPPVSAPSSPSSVVRYDDREVSPLEEPEMTLDEPIHHESPAIPERKATIKTGGKLKARPSATPADLHMMAQQRRMISADYTAAPPSATEDAQIEDMAAVEDDARSVHSSDIDQSKADSGLGTSPENKQQRLQLDVSIPSLHDDAAGDGFDLDQEFDRVIEGQKKGYLMRQNTKVVVASNRNFSGESNGTVKSAEQATPLSPTCTSARGIRSAHSSPRKPSADQVLKTEPWNGKARRKSQRNISGQQHRFEPAPPLPGMPSALGVVEEDFAAGTSSLEEEVGEGVERGRLFVKVVGVKHLELPMPKNDRVYFQLTLDNGLHCVTTSNIEMGSKAPIGQEFELVVLNDLEFQLTLTTRLPPPPRASVATAASPVKSVKVQKTNTFSRFLSSPKKRAEKERQEREAAEAEEQRLVEEARRKRASAVPTVWDQLRELVNPNDGSFARAYVNLKSHEKQCFGRQLTVDVPCYNEWALEKDTNVVNSVRSKRGNNTPVRRPPYVIGQLELQLFYVPKPKDATDEDMPKSMSGAVREMAKAGDVKEVVHEGYLSQQGGDCVHWRRRFFRLQGPKLTAYHEHTNQKRAVINLSKASRIVDDRTTLVADPKVSSKASSRRKSAFAEEDEGYAYVEEGFRIRFGNGETIDFYADSRAAKDLWMQALAQVIGKQDSGARSARWTDLVLAKEKASNPAIPVGTDVRDFTVAEPPTPNLVASAEKSLPASPVKGFVVPERKGLPVSPPKKELPRPSTPPMKARTGHRSRDAVKSMIF